MKQLLENRIVLAVLVTLSLSTNFNVPVFAQQGCDRVVDNTPIQIGIDTLNPGQTLCVKSGVYRERIILNQSGITVKNFPGSFPILDGGYNRRLMVYESGNPRGKATTPTAAHLPTLLVSPDSPDDPDAIEEFTFSSMVSMTANNTRFEGFILQNLAGQGVSMNGQNQTVQNNKFFWLYGPAILSNNPSASEDQKSRNLNILNNRMLFTSVINLDPRYNPTQPDPNTGGDFDLTLQAIKIGNCRGPIRIAGNYAAFSYGEGFDIGKGCMGTAENPIIVENNIIHDTNHVKFYAVHPQFVHFRNNIAYDTNQTSIYSDGTPADGYRSTNEVAGAGQDPANNIFFYNNIAYNNDTAIALEDRGESGSNIYVGFNTLVSGPQTRELTKFKETGNGIVENNIFHYIRRKQMGGNNAQGQNIVTGNPGSYTFRNNFWTHQPTQSWARSPADKYGDPLLVNSNFNVTITGFPTLGYANDQYLNYSNINFTTNFTANNYSLTTQSSQAINTAAVRQAFDGFMPPSYPYERDYSNSSRQQPDIGAIELSNGSSDESPGNTQGDYTGDDVVNYLDYQLVRSHFNAPYTLLDLNKVIKNYQP